MRLCRVLFVLLLVSAFHLSMVQISSASFVIGGEDGWQFSTDGNVNIFAAYESGDDKPIRGGPHP